MQVSLDIPANLFSIDETLSCGQVLRWRKRENRWYGVAKDRVLRVSQHDGRLEVASGPGPTDREELRTYFGLNDDLDLIFPSIAKDETIRHAIQTHRGLRIIRQDPWECLVTYICATFKNIPAIQKMLDNIARSFGRKIEFEGETYYTLPTPTDLSKADLTVLRACGAGFRAKYLIASARAVHSGKIDLHVLRDLSLEEARPILLGKEAQEKLLPGVGPKVADCVLLFSLSKLDAFPIDVWISKVLAQYYSELLEDRIPSADVETLRKSQPLTPKQYERISTVMREYFGKYAGYAEEYLFAFARSSGRKAFSRRA